MDGPCGRGRSGREAPDVSSFRRRNPNELRALRRRIATEIGMPPYIVFSDVTLEGLARARPTSPERFLQVRGVGQKKLEAFGERLLAEIGRRPEAGDTLGGVPAS